MAATIVVNGPAPYQALTRGRPVKLGQLTVAVDCVQFSLVQEMHTPNGLECLTITTDLAGTEAAVTPVLEASIDAGVSWFGVLPRAAEGTAPNYDIDGQFNSDPAVSSASSYDVSSLQAGATFRFGGWTAGTPNVWALYG